MQKQGKNLFIIDDGSGSKDLGRFVRDYRTGLSPEMRLEDLQKKIEDETGYEISISTLSKFENGRMKFSINLCVAIATVLKIKHPLEDRYYEGWDFAEAARENLDLSTGLPPKKKRGK